MQKTKKTCKKKVQKRKAPAHRPTSVPVLGQTYEVRWDEPFENNYGLCDADNCILHIYKADRVASTFVHELIHGILAVSGLSQLLGAKTEEALCRAIENGLIPNIQTIAAMVRHEEKLLGDSSLNDTSGDNDDDGTMKKTRTRRRK